MEGSSTYLESPTSIPLVPVARANTSDSRTHVSLRLPSEEVKDNRPKLDDGQEKHSSELKLEEQNEDEEPMVDLQLSVKCSKPELTTKELIEKLRADGKLDLLTDWINELLSENGGMVVKDRESSFAIRALNHVRQKWATIQEEPLPLTVARHVAEKILFDICNKRARIYRCGICNLDKNLSFGPLFHHIATQHHGEEVWKAIMKTSGGEPARSWFFAPWPESLPVREKPIIRTQAQESKALKDHMMETIWEMNKFRDMPASSRLALWFYLTLNWYIKYLEPIRPSQRRFSQNADYVLENTGNPIFGALQCNVCGKIRSRKSNQWGWQRLGKHFERAHIKVEADETWMKKMIALPADKNISTFGEDIIDDETREEWLKLWRIVDEGMKKILNKNLDPPEEIVWSTGL